MVAQAAPAMELHRFMMIAQYGSVELTWQR